MFGLFSVHVLCMCMCMHALPMHASFFFGFQSLPSIVHASETTLLGNNAGTSVDFTARHLRTPSCGTSARKIVLVISACQAAEPSLGTSAPRRVFNLRQALKLQTFARIRPHQPSCGRNLCARLRSSPPCAFESNDKERFRVQEIAKLPDLR